MQSCLPPVNLGRKPWQSTLAAKPGSNTWHGSCSLALRLAVKPEPLSSPVALPVQMLEGKPNDWRDWDLPNRCIVASGQARPCSPSPPPRQSYLPRPCASVADGARERRPMHDGAGILAACRSGQDSMAACQQGGADPSRTPSRPLSPPPVGCPGRRCRTRGCGWHEGQARQPAKAERA
jgi:hypothetical protein